LTDFISFVTTIKVIYNEPLNFSPQWKQ